MHFSATSYALCGGRRGTEYVTLHRKRKRLIAEAEWGIGPEYALCCAPSASKLARILSPRLTATLIPPEISAALAQKLLKFSLESHRTDMYHRERPQPWLKYKLTVPSVPHPKGECP